MTALQRERLDDGIEVLRLDRPQARNGGDNLKLAWPGGRLGAPVGPARLTPLVGLARAKEPL